jgi:hypothetical protein
MKPMKLKANNSGPFKEVPEKPKVIEKKGSDDIEEAELLASNSKIKKMLIK